MRCMAVLTVLSLCLYSEMRGQSYPGNNSADRSPLTLHIAGNGSISPNLDQHLLRVGATYRITARPGPGYVFSNWTGGPGGTDPQLTFIMESNLVLEASFVLNPFGPVQGNYAGLFAETNGV